MQKKEGTNSKTGHLKLVSEKYKKRKTEKEYRKHKGHH
jgi:hypothetical protein